MMAQFTALGRPIDPTYPTNLWIVALTVLAAVVGAAVAVLRGEDPLALAVFTAIMTLVAWIVGREADPAYELSAFVGAGIALVSAPLIGSLTPYVAGLDLGLALILVIQLARVVSRVVGPPALLTDTVLVLVLTALTVFLTPFWTLGLVAAGALVLDARLTSPLYPARRAHLPAALVAASFVAISAIINGLPGPGEGDTLLFAVVAVISGLYVWTIRDTREVLAVADTTGDLLNPLRVRAAMIVVLLACGLMLWHGVAGVAALAPVWMALAGAALYRVVLRVRRR